MYAHRGHTGNKIDNNGTQTKHPATKPLETQCPGPRQNVDKDKMSIWTESPGNKVWRDNTSGGTKYPEAKHLWDKVSVGTKCPEGTRYFLII